MFETWFMCYVLASGLVNCDAPDDEPVTQQECLRNGEMALKLGLDLSNKAVGFYCARGYIERDWKDRYYETPEGEAKRRPR